MTVRVRFAPSPTGFLHLGGLRTALYNFLFAQQNKGSFILRIEDTDRKRIVPGAVEAIERVLTKLQLIPKESPGNGGDYGPYFQSQRLDLYRSNLDTLLKNGNAYACFCSPTRLDLIRKDAIRRREVPKYDNKCRNLSRKQVEEKIRQGLSHCYRFVLRSEESNFRDLVYGPYDYNPAAHEGDPVIMKEDGYPTYHFANVVDDHLMDISHVLRGEEWLISTPKHILMYKAFGWTPPRYAHLPLILNKDGSKLSKRQDDLRVESLFSKGFYPLTILNFVTKIGGGFDEKLDDLVSLDELVDKFNLTSLNSSSCRLDMNRLDLINQLEIKRRAKYPLEEKMLIDELKDIVLKRLLDNKIDKRVLSEEYIRRVIHWASSESRIVTLKDLASSDFSYLWEPPTETSFNSLHGFNIKGRSLDDLISIIGSSNEGFDRSELTKQLKAFAKKENVPFPVVMKFLRGSLSNLKEGPSVGEMIEVLGIKETVSRLSKVKKYLDSNAIQDSRNT
ncbi:nondiscriminating glutamyl-tRNA synthetase EARS2, mitochondrial-like [Artemia franciscana]|uniref:Nondiscriminating glutamyl-tRNA synthetase EARS2, mitochondrial n=2 Tax=Artemia franciscana TaxID=6661 RepID=A0AA88HD94_ARTSF|nr:hypothetical protein QYM36_014823 [Artemia franciscana]